MMRWYCNLVPIPCMRGEVPKAGPHVRIVRDIDSLRIQLRYTLTAGDRVVASAEEQVSDMNFMVPANRYSSGDRLRYEKATLDDWFDKRFSKR